MNLLSWLKIVFWDDLSNSSISYLFSSFIYVCKIFPFSFPKPALKPDAKDYPVFIVADFGSSNFY